VFGSSRHFVGCGVGGVEFNAESIIQEDGSIERITTFKAQEDSDHQELL